MFGFRKTNPDITKLLAAANKAQGLIDDLRQADLSNATFEQAGLLDGSEIIRDYVEENEWGLAVEHLFYKIYEGEIDFPADELNELYSIAIRNGIQISYVGKSL
ncbi:MAG: hypothetical protein KF831_01580 [Acidobacteria bacterium]|nr:hypothetical protein [Acidobacteriota bacterium]